MPPPTRYDGRVAIVTGAGGGLGRKYAEFLASRGARVLVNDLNENAATAVVRAIEAAGGAALANTDSVVDGEKIVAAAVGRGGRVDIVVSNAGVLRDTSYHKMSPKDFALVHSVHVGGAFAVTRAAWPHMREARYGRIVLITSVNGLYGQFGQANYSSAKAALVGFAKTLAAEGAGRNIKVNALAPGAGTAMTATIMPPELVAKWKQEYVVPCVAYLASEEVEASGDVFEAGGGWMAQVRWQRSPGFFFDLSREFGPEHVAEAWHKITEFGDDAVIVEDDRQAHDGLNGPQMRQIVQGPCPSKL